MAGLLDRYGRPLKLVAGKILDPDEEQDLMAGATTMRHQRNGYDMPWPATHMAPHGHLAATSECAAIWYFIRLAHNVVAEVEGQVTLTGDEDVAVSMKAMARSCAVSYGVEVADMFEPENIRRTFAEATRCGRTIHPRIHLFLASGGQTNNNYDRIADAPS